MVEEFKDITKFLSVYVYCFVFSCNRYYDHRVYSSRIYEMKNICGLFLLAIGSHILLLGMKMVKKQTRLEIIDRFRKVFNDA